MAKLPWFAWYADDWLSDECLRLCSLAARGLWIDMLSLMHKSGHRGFLERADGSPFTSQQLSRCVGCSVEEVESLLRELNNVGVTSATDLGVIYSRRMARDEKISQERARAGKKGGEAKAAKQNSSKQASKSLANGLAPSGSLEIQNQKEPESKSAQAAREDFEKSAEHLANLFCFHQSRTKDRGGRKADDEVDITPIFKDLLTICDAGRLIERIKDPKRMKSQWAWEFEKEVKGEQANGQPRAFVGSGARVLLTGQQTAGIEAKTKRIGPAENQPRAG